mgnify:CR=1 FL=1
MARDGERRLELGGRDAEGRHLQHDVPPLVLDAEVAALVKLVLQPEHPLAAREEVARVLEEQEAYAPATTREEGVRGASQGVEEEEAEEVGVEQRAEQLCPHRDRPPQVGGGEGGVHVKV